MNETSEAGKSTVIISRRFRGPPNSGNGGYTCGLIARNFEGPVEVTLTKPPPLDTPLSLALDKSTARLCAGDEEIATGRPCKLDMLAPESPSLADADKASRLCFFPKEHIIPGCFVCGPDRMKGDGLQIFAGLDEKTGIAAATYIPDREFADSTQRIVPEIIWAMLDCPGYFGFARPRPLALLGRMSAEIIERPCVEELCIVAGWRIGQEGRKHFAGTAIYSESGRILAKARAIWIELPQVRFAAV